MKALGKALFLIFLFLQLSLVWAFPRYATQDGPSHLYNAAIIAALRSGTWNGVSSFFRLNPRLVPNWTTYFVLIQLMKEFSAANAEKILVSIYFILLSLSFWWVVEQLRPGSEHFLIWGLVLGGNWFLSMGFYNFCFGLALFMLSFGFWLRWRANFGAWQCLVLFILASLLYVTHLFCFLMAALLIGITGSALCLSELRQRRQQGNPFPHSARILIRSLVLPEMCFMVFLLLHPFSAAGIQYLPQPAPAQSPMKILHGLTENHGARIFCLPLDFRGLLAKIIILLLIAFIAAAFYWTLRRSREPISALSYGLAVFSVICLLFFVFCGDSYSGIGLLRERAGWFGLWGVFAFLASRDWKTRGKRFVSIVAAIVLAMSLLSGALWRRQISPLLGPYSDAARMVEPGKTMLSLSYCSLAHSDFQLFKHLAVQPFLHAGEITALDGRDFSVANYEGTGTSFPDEYLPEVNPAIREPEMMKNDSMDADLVDFEEKTGKSIDYVLVCGAPDFPAQGKRDSRLWTELRARYTLIYSSPGPVPLRLFKEHI